MFPCTYKIVYVVVVVFRGSKLTQLLRDAMGSAQSQMCMIAHVSSHVQSYNETLQVIQLASKIHRTKRRSMKRVSVYSNRKLLFMNDVTNEMFACV